MKTTDFINENFVTDAAEAHQDHEVQMARSDCYNAAKYAIELHKLLKNISEQQGLDGWVSEKITLANDYLRTVTEYLRYEQQSGSQSDMPEFDVGSATQTLDSVLGESTKSELQEGAFTWYLKAHGRLLSPLTSDEPYKFRSKEEAVAFAKEKYKTNWQNIVPTTYDVPNSLADQPDSGWNEKNLKTVHEEDDEEPQQKRKPVVVKTNKEIVSRVADIGPGGKEYNVKTDKAWDDQHKEVDEGLGKSIKRAVQGWGGAQDKPADIVKRNKAHDTDTAKRLRAGMDDAPEHTPQGLQKRVLDRKLKGVEEGKADPTGSWVVYNGTTVKRFKTRDGAKAYAEKNGGKVASSEFYADNIQNKGVAEADKHSMIGKFKRGEELYGKVKSSFKDIGDAQKKGDSIAASKAFRKHERYANLRAPGTWTNTKDEGVAESASAGATGSASIATTPSGKSSKNVGSLFGGEFQQRTPFTAKKKK
jgi:hypothetical protein